MKKTIVLVMALVLGLAFSAYAQTTTVKETVKKTDDKTVTTVEAKGPQGGVVKEKTTVTPGEVVTKSDVKGPGGSEVKKTTTETPGKVAGTTKFDMKKGAIEDLKIDWTYEKVGNDYVLSYNVKEQNNPNLAKELGLTPDQAKSLKVGAHKITSTSPYTAGDVQQNFRKLIIQDLKTMK